MPVSFQIPKLSLKENKIVLRCPYADKDLAKSVAGYKWDGELKAWVYPIRPEVFADLRRLFPHMQIDPDAITAVQKIEDREREARRLKDDVDESELDNLQLPVRVKPFLHQKKAFKIGTTLPNFAALMEMGCGKTLTAIAIAGHRYLYDGLRRVLVVAPLSVVPVWPKEFAEYAAYPAQVIPLTGSSTEKGFNSLKVRSKRFAAA